MRLRWKIGLSDGTNYIEGNAPFDVIQGELSPWLRLQDHIKDNNLTIKSLSLIELFPDAQDNRTFNLPSAGKNPKFRAFDMAEKPKDYNFFRMVAGDINSKDQTKIDTEFAVIEAIYENHSVQLWVDERNTRNCWVLSK